MAVFRIERTKDYTVMSNHHLRNAQLSLKAKGLLSMMLSLPEDWNYTTRGLAKICKEGVDAIGGAIRELEKAGYIVRHQLRDGHGRISDTEYVIYERPRKPEKSPDTETPDPEEAGLDDPYPASPDTDKPDTDLPCTENPYLVNPYPENPAELNIDRSNTHQPKKDPPNTHSIPSGNRRGKGTEGISQQEMEDYREEILENIGYDQLREELSQTQELDEIVDLILETVCTDRQTVRVAGSNLPYEMVKERLLRLDGEHIRFVLDCMSQNTTKIRNIKQYLLTTLFNAPATMGNYYAARVSHDLYGEPDYDPAL